MTSLDEEDKATVASPIGFAKDIMGIEAFFKLSPMVLIGKRKFAMPVSYGALASHSPFVADMFEISDFDTPSVLLEVFDIDPMSRGFHFLWYQLNGIKIDDWTWASGLSPQDVVIGWQCIDYLRCHHESQLVDTFADLTLDAVRESKPHLDQCIKLMPKSFGVRAFELNGMEWEWEEDDEDDT